MQFSTKIDHTSETLNEVAQLAASIEEDRVLAAILNKRLTHDDIVNHTLRLRYNRRDTALPECWQLIDELFDSPQK